MHILILERCDKTDMLTNASGLQEDLLSLDAGGPVGGGGAVKSLAFKNARTSLWFQMVSDGYACTMHYPVAL